jgi:hypothetical protein
MTPEYALFTDTNEGEAMCARLRVLRDEVAPILAINLQTELTDHSVDHSGHVALLVSALAAPLAPDRRLSDIEAFILYAACYLHDIGMQYEQAEQTQTIKSLGLPRRLDEMSHEERGYILRKHHNRISADLVMQSFVNGVSPIVYQFRDAEYPHFIASLCEGHTLDIDGAESDRYAQLMSEGKPIRMALISGLLRMGDILDESRHRASVQKRKALLLPLLSQAHWYRHYYTRDIVVDPTTRTISLHFIFPRSKRDDYNQIIPRLSGPEIRDELNRHNTPFIKYGLVWVVELQRDDNPLATAEEMPPDVELEMVGILRISRLINASFRVVA